MDIVISGVITQVLPARQGVSQKTGQPWMSQEYLLCHEQGPYPRYICFRVFGQDKIQQMNIQLNDILTVHLNVNAQPGQNGFFNSIDAWKVERQSQPAMPGSQQGYPQPQGYPQQTQQYTQQAQPGAQPYPQGQMPYPQGQMPFPPKA